MYSTLQKHVSQFIMAGIFTLAGELAYSESDYAPFNFPEISKEANSPIILGPAGETFDFIRTSKETCGKYLFAKLVVPPHVGPPPHVHHWTDEWFYAPNGGFVMFMGQNLYPDLKLASGEGHQKIFLI